MLKMGFVVSCSLKWEGTTMGKNGGKDSAKEFQVKSVLSFNIFWSYLSLSFYGTNVKVKAKFTEGLLYLK